VKHEDHRHAGRFVAALGVLTVSDTRTTETDRSGRLAIRLLEQAGHRVFDYRIHPDDPGVVRDQIEQWLGQTRCDGVLVNGGTGIAARDRTYEAVVGLLDQRLPGFGELFRTLSYEEIGSAAMLSRAVAGIARGRPLFSMPGSTAAVELAMSRLIVPELPHLLGELRKDAGHTD
jgi:molybdenum cofactor biosynthesis protein B